MFIYINYLQLAGYCHIGDIQGLWETFVFQVKATEYQDNLVFDVHERSRTDAPIRVRYELGSDSFPRTNVCVKNVRAQPNTVFSFEHDWVSA